MRRRRSPARRPPASRAASAIAPDALVIYELNLRGFTRAESGRSRKALRGTFAGLAHPASIAHLAALGVTAVELMPADAFVDERHLPPLGLTNAWGYNPVVFGAPDPRLAPGGWAEVRAATDALHAAGIEVILDVVLNHNGESDAVRPDAVAARPRQRDLLPPRSRRSGAATSTTPAAAIAWRSTVRWSSPWRSTRCGAGWSTAASTASASISRPRSAAARDGFDPHAPFFQALAQDPLLREAQLIAEPWDVGPGGYQLGAFPRRLGRMERPLPRRRAPLLARRRRHARRDRDPLAGSRDVFARAAAPSKSVNFVTAHDGFTLADLVSYARKHNEANGEDNRDGTDANYSWNHGVEGPTDDPAIVAARARDQRNLLTLLLVVARHADAGDGRRARPQPGRQQQRLRAGQRDDLDRLERGRRGADRLRAPSHRASAATIRRCRATPS